uniref:Uncharacterized protein n=1 Tax=Sexangularia sp. CB-2014 TaxID=1486929 RepID=A0A7S1VCL8_9EUKA
MPDEVSLGIDPVIPAAIIGTLFSLVLLCGLYSAYQHFNKVRRGENKPTPQSVSLAQMPALEAAKSRRKRREVDRALRQDVAAADSPFAWTAKMTLRRAKTGAPRKAKTVSFTDDRAAKNRPTSTSTSTSASASSDAPIPIRKGEESAAGPFSSSSGGSAMARSATTIAGFEVKNGVINDQFYGERMWISKTGMVPVLQSGAGIV